ncbi:MAG: phenylacetate--CoA ligase family protein [Planctomycetaceae bacterium]
MIDDNFPIPLPGNRSTTVAADVERSERDRLRMMTRPQLHKHQLDRVNALLANAVATHPFYRARFERLTLPLTDLSQLHQLPFLEKSDMLPGMPATICDWDRTSYVHAHQTSGTTGNPILVLDSHSDWRWWTSTWQYVLDAAEATSADTAFMAFSYGPFVGFWSAHDALVQRGVLVVPGGGMTSLARLHAMAACGATLLCCTPTYALHLATVARQSNFDLSASKISRIIVAGESGGSIPEVRSRIESAWQARVVDHCGATEVGPWGVGDRQGLGVHVIESEFIAETIVFDDRSPSGREAAEGELAELVLTGLGRYGAPAIRYRTGDLVRAEISKQPDNQFLFLRGGVIGRVDDMVVIRGVNVFPTSVEAIVRRIAGDVEYRVNRSRHQEMDQLRIEVEGEVATARRLHDAFREQLGLRIEVSSVDPGTLPRFEGKAKRWIKF